MASNQQNWCFMVLPFDEEKYSEDLGRLSASLRKSTFHGLSYTDFLEAFESWLDTVNPNKIVLMFVMAEIAANPNDEPVQERANRLYYDHPALALMKM